MRRQVLAVQQTEMLGHFLVTPHRVGHARAGVDARQRGADQRQENRQRFHQHERRAMSAQQRVADDHHHVANRRR